MSLPRDPWVVAPEDPRGPPGTQAQAALQTVRGACSGVEALQAAVVFGSVLAGDAPRDLDLALLWDPACPEAARWQRANRVAAEVEHALQHARLNVDVKDLRALPLVLQHRVLRDGRVAWVGDRQALVRFASETVPRALDFLPGYRRMLRASARELVHGRS